MVSFEIFSPFRGKQKLWFKSYWKIVYFLFYVWKQKNTEVERTSLFSPTICNLWYYSYSNNDSSCQNIVKNRGKSSKISEKIGEKSCFYHKWQIEYLIRLLNVTGKDRENGSLLIPTHWMFFVLCNREKETNTGYYSS